MSNSHVSLPIRKTERDRLRPTSTLANFDFSQFLDVEFWDDKVWGTRRVEP